MKPEEVSQYMDALSKGISDLAVKLQQPAEKIFELFLRQNYIKGIVGIFQIILIIIGTIFIVKFFQWGNKKDEKDYYETRFENSEVLFPILVVMLVIITFCWALVIFGGFEEVISRFINPNYMVIKDIIRLIQSGTN